MSERAKTRADIDLPKVGALGAIMLALSSFAFFRVAGSTFTSITEPARFLADAADQPGLAVTFAWGQAWLGLLTVPFYLGLHAGLRRGAENSTLIALVTGVMWGGMLLLVTPVVFAAVHYLAPLWSRETDLSTRTSLLHVGSFTLRVIATQVTIVFFVRALSVAAASWAMLVRGGRPWRWMGWLGLAYGIEHAVAGVLHETAAQGGVNTLLGAVGGFMFVVWLCGAGVGLWRLPKRTPLAAA
jgi:hypothetical protein